MEEEKIVNVQENKEILEVKAVKQAEKPVSLKEFVMETVKFTLLSLAIVIPIRFFIAQPFLVSGSSMVPTFTDGEYLIVDEISYYFNNPARGQVIVFRYPKLPSKYFIKRIIGLPGETVIIKDGTLTIKDGKTGALTPLTEGYTREADTLSRDMSIELKDKEYFVMGDNRNESSDSRDWGPLKSNFITGKVFLRLLPLTKITMLPGHVSEYATDTEPATGSVESDAINIPEATTTTTK